jgi:hypothetical protein
MNAFVCDHHAMHAHSKHMGQGARMPGDGPCFCSQMIGAFDQTVSVAAPALSVPALHTVTPGRSEANASLFPLPPSPVVTLETPPPIVA